MAESTESRHPKIIRRTVFTVVAVVAIAAGLRLATAAPRFAASATTVVALSALAIGLFLHGRDHSRPWRSAWVLLSLSLAVATVATTATTVGGQPTSYPAPLDWIGVGCGLVALVAVCLLLRTRTRGRAVDALLEGVLIASAFVYFPWAWAGTRGTGQLAAAAALIPVAVWIVALWVSVRLLFLTSEQLAAYRYLAASFLCLVAFNASLAGERLGGGVIGRDNLAGIVLWGYCLWGASALHPSLGKNFEPAAPRASRFGLPKLLVCLAAIAVAPVTLVVLISAHDLAGLKGLIAGSAVVPGLVAVYLIRQVRDRARAEYRAQHDPLTGLPNQTLFHDRVEGALAHARRSASGVAVMFLDLDRFKSINDSLGHAVGDELLQAVAKRLRDTVRETDTVARMGGDEFTVLLSDAKDKESAVTTAAKIIELFSRPFIAGGRELHTTTSIGVALYPSDGDDVEALLKHADSAMYRAKARGRNAFEFFTPDLSIRAKARLSVESGLRQALDRRGLELHYQPQVDVRTGAVVGLEALARWRHNEIGIVMPDVFVPVAEETGLIVPLGDWAIDQAAGDLRRWLNAGIMPRPVAVNVSVRQLSEDSFVDKVARILDRHDVPRELLELEITESIFMRDLTRTTATLEELRELGVHFSIDDFGTGFSGLSYLAGMPIDSLKIDQSFVSHVQKLGDDAPIIEAIIGLAHALNLNVVAEGVESVDQAMFLVAHGCNEMQGYLFSAALPADDIADLLVLDDQTTINWLGCPQDGPFPEPQTIVRERASLLLAAICGGGVIAGQDHEEIAAILTALIPVENIAAAPSALRTASMRIAVGTFAGLVPLSTGLAAAQVLPRPIQSAVSASLSTAGVALPTAAGGGDGPSGDSVLLAASRTRASGVTNGSVDGARSTDTVATTPATDAPIGSGDSASSAGGSAADGSAGAGTSGGGIAGGGTAGGGTPGTVGGGSGGGTPGSGTPGSGTPGGGTPGTVGGGTGGGTPGGGTPGTVGGGTGGGTGGTGGGTVGGGTGGTGGGTVGGGTGGTGGGTGGGGTGGGNSGGGKAGKPGKPGKPGKSGGGNSGGGNSGGGNSGGGNSGGGSGGKQGGGNSGGAKSGGGNGHGSKKKF